MADHRQPGIFTERGRRGYGPGRHSAGAALELDSGQLLQPVPGHVQGVPVGDPGRVSLELHLAGGQPDDRSDGIWRV